MSHGPINVVCPRQSPKVPVLPCLRLASRRQRLLPARHFLKVLTSEAPHRRSFTLARDGLDLPFWGHGGKDSGSWVALSVPAWRG